MEDSPATAEETAELKPSRDPPARGMGRGPVILVLIVATLLVIHGLRKSRFNPSGGRVTPQKSDSAIPRLDPNTADLRDLRLIPGLGPSLAEKLVEYRGNHRINKPHDLREIPGFGRGTVEKIQSWFQWPDGADAFGEARDLGPGNKGQSSGDPFISRPAKIRQGDPLLDINTASADDLMRLPGVGPLLARRIVEERESKSFSSIDDLMRVAGIGPKTFERIKGLVKAGMAPPGGK